ncbi:PPE domain-containing protein [Nocardia sp. CDC160]|uniref:PPE domain-containing protein n=1 Tax=Nocardia sp. CDC160 TaxID=3112166 RepID=UPI002DBDE80E|nr:PPE domain-containing protein [Nocardia sp. CDC160]MEC3919252.1 PPE domain-containing protein [Nocardia sp. CDC160]
MGSIIKTPAPGFTGVVWEARPAEQLVGALASGNGAVGLVDAGAAWARIGVDFAAAALHLGHIMEDLQDAWRSDSNQSALACVSRIRAWLDDSANSASDNAQKAAGHAVAYQTAVMEMPNVAEVTALSAAQQAIAQSGTGLGAALIGAGIQLDGQREALDATAARVMRSYELATAPLAIPWQQRLPSTIDSGAVTSLTSEPMLGAGVQTSAALQMEDLVALVPLVAQSPRVIAVVTSAQEVDGTTEQQVSVRAQDVDTSAGILPSNSGLPRFRIAEGPERGEERVGCIESGVSDAGQLNIPNVTGASDRNMSFLAIRSNDSFPDRGWDP